MADSYESVRNIPFPALVAALGIENNFKRSRDEWVGACPIHGGKKSNSFRYKDDGRFNCFSEKCHGKGAIDLVTQVRRIPFQEAVAWLKALKAETPAETTKPPTKAADEAVDGVLKPYSGKYEKFQVPCPWLEARIPDAGIREKYGVFMYSNPSRQSAYSGRVMIPVKDIQGNLYGYLGRATASESDQPHSQDIPKYLFPRDLPKSQFLFGAYELRQHLAGISPLPSSRYKEIYLVESPFAVMKFASLGLPAVSPFGWSVSKEQVSLLSEIAKGVIFLPDTNKRAEANHNLGLLAERLWLRFPPLPPGCDDPESLPSREAVLALTSG